MTSIDVPVRVRTGRSGVVGPVVIGLGLVAVLASGLGTVFAGLVAAVLIAVATWRHPAWACVAMVGLLPLSRFINMLVLHFTGSATLTLASQLWKDLLIGVLVLRAVDELVMGRRVRFRLLDAVVGCFVLLGTVYLVFPGSDVQLDLLPRFLGWRADVQFVLAYLVGRTIVFRPVQLRWLLGILVPGSTVVALVAAGQFIWPTWFVDRFNELGYTEFVQGQGSFGELEVIRDRGLSGIELPRAGSLFLADLALSFFVVFAIAVAASIFFTAKGVRAAGALALVGALLATATFTVTRSAIVACLLAVGTIAILTRQLGRTLAVGAGCLLAGLVIVTSGLIPVDAISALTDPQEGSAQAHFDAIDESLLVIEDQPLGRGLGTAGAIGQRFAGDQALTNENWYLQIATELGIVPGLLFLAITLWVLVISIKRSWTVSTLELRRIALATAGTSVGFLLIANLLHAWEVSVLSMVIMLFAGITVGADERDAELTQAEAPTVAEVAA